MHDIVLNGDFEAPTAQIARSGGPGEWVAFIHGRSDATLTRVDGEGRGGSRCVRYKRTQPGSDNVHLDQIIPVEKNSAYEATAWIRADGRLNPMLAVMTMDWAVLASVPSNAEKEWTQVRLVFYSYDNDQVRFSWLPGAEGRLYTGAPGSSWMDDASVTKLEHVPSEMARAFELLRQKKSEEMDLASVRPGPVGKPAPLRPIRCEDGVLVHDDGSEVALWGVNLQTALFWEYRARMEPCGIPLEVEALKRVAERNLDEMQRMNVSVVRMHLLPSDFSDAEGNLKDTIFLDLLDYTIAKCHERGIYVYLTLINEMGCYYVPDSFIVPPKMRKREAGRKIWLVDPDYVRKTERYVRNLVERENRYAWRKYKDEAAIAVFEIMNEPGYVDYAEMGTEEAYAPLRQGFEMWRASKGLSDNLNLYYPLYRYEYVKEYVDRMCAAIRGAGAQKPIAWNLNWPHMIGGHEDVFQAVADSTVDVVSFCLYPGQEDVPSPFWNHPTDLSGKNYLPFLRRHYDEYRRLRWLLGKRFAGKAKAVYEFETFYNQTSYLYPAMARLFRSLGAQIAHMWTYSLTPTAEYLGGSHHLNLYCTPQKAVSFIIAEAVFAESPRYAPYDATGTDPVTFDHCAVSFARGGSILQTPDRLMYSRSFDWSPWPARPDVKEIIGCGGSSLVSYDGTGAYFVRVGKDSIDITIDPDATFTRPPWQRQAKKPWAKSCLLDSQTAHPFALHLPGWKEDFTVYRIEGGQATPVPNDGPTPNFRARAGQYRVERKAPSGKEIR